MFDHSRLWSLIYATHRADVDRGPGFDEIPEHARESSFYEVDLAAFLRAEQESPSWPTVRRIQASASAWRAIVGSSLPLDRITSLKIGGPCSVLEQLDLPSLREVEYGWGQPAAVGPTATLARLTRLCLRVFDSPAVARLDDAIGCGTFSGCKILDLSWLPKCARDFRLGPVETLRLRARPVDTHLAEVLPAIAAKIIALAAAAARNERLAAIASLQLDIIGPGVAPILEALTFRRIDRLTINSKGGGAVTINGPVVTFQRVPLGAAPAWIASVRSLEAPFVHLTHIDATWIESIVRNAPLEHLGISGVLPHGSAQFIVDALPSTLRSINFHPFPTSYERENVTFDRPSLRSRPFPNLEGFDVHAAFDDSAAEWLVRNCGHGRMRHCHVGAGTPSAYAKLAAFDFATFCDLDFGAPRVALEALTPLLESPRSDQLAAFHAPLCDRPAELCDRMMSASFGSLSELGLWEVFNDATAARLATAPWFGRLAELLMDDYKAVAGGVQPRLAAKLAVK